MNKCSLKVVYIFLTCLLSSVTATATEQELTKHVTFVVHENVSSDNDLKKTYALLAENLLFDNDIKRTYTFAPVENFLCDNDVNRRCIFAIETVFNQYAQVIAVNKMVEYENALATAEFVNNTPNDNLSIQPIAEIEVPNCEMVKNPAYAQEIAFGEKESAQLGSMYLPYKVEFRSAAFFHSAKRFREIYGDVGPSFQFEASMRCFEIMEAWINVDWFSKQRSHGDCCHSRINLPNFSFGINYVYPFSRRFDLYCGGGPSLGRITLKNKSCCIREKKSKYILGVVFKSGVRYYIFDDLFIDLFVDYIVQRVDYKHHVDVGGLKTGLGIGVGF